MEVNLVNPRIIEALRMRDGVIITFEDGKYAKFPASLLYAMVLNAAVRHVHLVERMLESRSLPPSSPSAFQASLQTSVFQASNRTVGAAMSLIKKADVKNHLSTRHRTEIHLYRPEDQQEVTVALEGSACTSAEMSDSAKNSPNVPPSSGRETSGAVTASGPNLAVPTQSKSAKQ